MLRLAVLALCLFAASPGFAAEGLYNGHGAYSMTVAKDIVIPYPDRKRGLEVRVTYPQGGEKLPVFVFSHGAFGSGRAYEPLASYIASHGYVVLQPTHADSMRYGRLPMLKNPMSFANWEERPAEVSYLIDSLGLVVEQVPALAKVMDPETIAVGGHSFGAHTAQLVAGMTVRRPFNYSNDKRRSMTDMRPKAFVIISPQGTGHIIDEKSYETLKRPALFVTGSNDKSPVNDKTYDWRLEAYRFAAPGDKYLLFIDGAHHNFGGISGRGGWAGAGPENADTLNTVRTTVLAFLDAYIKNDAGARAWLDGGDLRKSSHGLAQITSK